MQVDPIDTLLGAIISALGLPPELIGELVLLVPIALFGFTLSSYVVSSRVNARAERRQKVARNIMAGARRRVSGLTQEEILARLRPREEDQKTTTRTLISVSEALLKLANFDKEATRKRLVAAGERDPRALSRYIIKRGMAMMIGPVAMFFVAPAVGFSGLMQIGLAVAGAVVGGILVDVTLDRAISTRRARMFEELPVLLDMLTIYIEAGAAFDIALARASQSLKSAFPTAAAEIYNLRRDLEMSVNRERTLREFSERINSQTARTFVAIIIQSERRGNPIAGALRTLARDARREAVMSVEQKAQKIPTLMQLPMLLFILPAIFASVLGPAVIQVMTTFNM